MSEADWKAAYLTAFVRIAVERGWSPRNAEVWAEQTVNDAYMECSAAAPNEQADADVFMIEATPA